MSVALFERSKAKAQKQGHICFPRGSRYKRQQMKGNNKASFRFALPSINVLAICHVIES